jgi:hypothetical protein
MIHFIVAHHDNDIFQKWLSPSLEKFKESTLVLVENQEDDSIFKKYNRGLDLVGVKEDDVYCFIHEDIKILDNYFVEKVEMIFSRFKDIGVLGVIGSKLVSDKLGWWLCDIKHHVGQIQQGLPNGTDFRMVKKVGFFKNVASVDGCCMFVSGKMIKDGFRFDEATYKGKYHFYDLDTCFTARQMGYDVAVADILVHHKSEGPMPENWFEARNEFEQKWKGKGINFPFELK